jgi:hypothetical protein
MVEMLVSIGVIVHSEFVLIGKSEPGTVCNIAGTYVDSLNANRAKPTE